MERISFIDLIKDKTIALVGPSCYLEGKNKGKLIDSNDIVIKINNYYKLPENDYGEKVDILFYNFSEIPKYSKKIKYIVQGHPPTVVKNKIMFNQSIKYNNIIHVRYPFELLNNYIKYQIYNTGSRKTTGFFVIGFLFSNLNIVKKLSIFGIDFCFNKYSTSYAGKITGHNMRNELSLFKNIYRKYKNDKIYIDDKKFQEYLDKI